MKSTKVKLLRPFWGHKAGTIGRIDKQGKLRLKGSLVATIYPRDLNTLYQVQP